MSHPIGPHSIDFLTLSDEPLELWHWETIGAGWADPPHHMLVLTETEPKTVQLAPVPVPFPERMNVAYLPLMNRGAPITFQFQGKEGAEEILLQTDHHASVVGWPGYYVVRYEPVRDVWHWLQVEHPTLSLIHI